MAPTPSLGIPGAHVNASNMGGSSWYVLSSGKQKVLAADFLNEIFAKDLDFYQIHSAIPRRRRLAGWLHAMARSTLATLRRSFFGGAKVWQQFSDYMAKGAQCQLRHLYRRRPTRPSRPRLPALLQGMPVEKAVLENIHQQLAAQIK